MSVVCSTGLDVTTIEWITDGVTVAMGNTVIFMSGTRYDFTVFMSSNQSLTLLLDPVSADYHNTQYTCRLTSPYGVQEETVNITVQGRFLIYKAAST